MFNTIFLQASAAGGINPLPILILLLTVGFVFLNGKIAKRKGYQFWEGAVSGVFLFIGTILFLVIPNQKKKDEDEVCPQCKTVNKDTAVHCKGCGEKLHQEQPKTNKCSKCGSSSNPTDAMFCGQCGNKLSHEQSATIYKTQSPKPHRFPIEWYLVGAIIGIVILVMVISLRGNKQDIEREIKRSFQTEMNTNPQYREYGMRVMEVHLVKAGFNSYNGIVKVLLQGNTHNVRISVTKYRGSYMWQTDPLAFAFLLEYMDFW